MNKILFSTLVMIFIIGFSGSFLKAQMAGLHGDDRETRIGVHAGNQFRISMFNDGTFGGRVNSKVHPLEVAGEWPINSGHFYLVDGNPLVLSEVIDNAGNLVHILSTNKSVNISQTRGPRDPVSLEWWTFLPLSGFAALNNDRIAMAKGGFEWSNSWPARWPDIADPNNPLYSSDGWAGSWNGYFGKNVFNADEESYFVADDYNNKMAIFYPDSNDLSRRGLGLRMYVRGFQWAKAAVEDGIFILYDLQNIGTSLQDKMVFGFKIGNNMGESTQGPDAGDDNAAYNREEAIAYMWDNDDLGAGNWSPVGYMGGAFLESPGNPYDGIDNDNDGQLGNGGTISISMFQPKTITLDEPIVVINYDNFERTGTTLRAALLAAGKGENDTLEIVYNGRILPETRFWAGKVLDYNGLSEIGDNLVDDNLNGLIDENRGQEDDSGIITYLYLGYKFIDYFTGIVSDNLLIDERRDDGIDNDGDWVALFDDVGADGIAPGALGYPGPDLGEGDGEETAGEPHFDKTDIDETDMLGLTSFYLYDWGNVFQYDPEMMWNGLAPGFFNYTFATANVELLYGSGYFPIVPGQIERFSMAILCGNGSVSDGTGLADLIRNKGYFAKAYNQNYNFSKAPFIPTVRAVTGDNKVTLFWDDFAESSVDPISGADFEGYKIYRSTDPGFNDAAPITDAYGSVIFRTPIAQFDLENEHSGLAPVPTQGVHFYLGNNTGLRHFWTDTTAINGFTYYYAVTSYDHGDPALGIDPSECTKYVALQSTGEIESGTNVKVVRPEAPAGGYVPPKVNGISGSGIIPPGEGNTGDGNVNFEIIDPTLIQNNHTYQISFKESLVGTGTSLTKLTGSFTLFDATSGDTLLADSPLIADVEGLPIIDGFQLSFPGNPDSLKLNTETSGWNETGIPNFSFTAYAATGNPPVELFPADFDIIFSEVVADTSKPFWRGTTLTPERPVNFTINNKITNQKVDFAFREIDTVRGGRGVFSWGGPSGRSSDDIIILTKHPQADTLIASWWARFSIPAGNNPDTIVPGLGDTLKLNIRKPFLAHDRFDFTTLKQTVDNELAKTDLDKIRVVPNPYIVTNSWEPRNPYSDGRGERALHFTHLPPECTIRIFNVRGQLVQTLEHNVSINDGTEIWNMLTKDNLEISYGIYIYHIDAPGVGEKIGKFVVIK